MEVKPALALPDGWEMTGSEIIDEVLTMTFVSTQIFPCCPLCGTPATRVHSRYTRQIADLPCGGQRVRLLVLVRKCFCKANTWLSVTFGDSSSAELQIGIRKSLLEQRKVFKIPS